MHVKLVRLIKICLTETYSRVRVGKNLSDMFPIMNGLNQGDVPSPLFFSFCFGVRNEKGSGKPGLLEMKWYTPDCGLC